MGPTDEQVMQAYERAPKVIQEALSGRNIVRFILSVQSKYNFHIDTVGYIGTFIRNMLLGLLNPSGFIAKLQSVGISENEAREITSDLNREIFIPLRDEIRKSGVQSSISDRSSIPDVPVMEIEVKRNVVAPEKIQETPSYNLIRPETPLAPGPTLSVRPQPAIRTMRHDAEILQHQEVQRVPTNTAMHLDAPHPSQTTPSRSFQTASVPYNTPQATYPEYQEPVPPPPVHANPIVTEKPSVNTATVSSDPYREPMQ